MSDQKILINPALFDTPKGNLQNKISIKASSLTQYRMQPFPLGGFSTMDFNLALYTWLACFFPSQQTLEWHYEEFLDVANYAEVS